MACTQDRFQRKELSLEYSASSWFLLRLESGQRTKMIVLNSELTEETRYSPSCRGSTSVENFGAYFGENDNLLSGFMDQGKG